jgi:spermidine/putrescine transport system ATP-binding protein
MGEYDAGCVLALVDVSKTYEGAQKRALDGVSFTVNAGEFFSILGPSGSGKTTVLRAIAGFEKPDSGRIVMEGRTINSVPPFKRDVRTVFQSYALFPHLTVRENVEYPLKMQGEPKAIRRNKAEETLALVEMSSLEDRLPHQLSGGQRQRAALARSIVSRPKILLLDEPLAALDLRLRQQMQHTLVALQKDLGIAFVYVTHDQGEAMSMSDRVLVLQDGRIAQSASPKEIYFAPQNEFVARFVGRSNLVPVHFEPAGTGYVGTVESTRIPALTSGRGGSARMAVRYEAVLISPMTGEAHAPDTIPGVVEDVLFMGTNSEVSVRCGGLRLIGTVPTTRDSAFAPGRRVQVAFDLENTRIFHD